MASIRLHSACKLAHTKASGNCSGAVKLIAKEMDLPLPDLDANHLIDHFNNPANGWTVVSESEAQNAADSNRLVVAGKQENPHGHVVVVLPGGKKASGGYQYTDKKTGLQKTAANHGLFPRSCSTALGGWPGGISKGDKTVFDAWGNADTYADVKYWLSPFRYRWTDPKLQLAPSAQSCFSECPRPELVSLTGDSVIYRLKTNVTEKELKKVEGTAIEESPWWFSRETYDAILRKAGKARGNISGCARVGLAVPPRFNRDFDTLVAVRLLRSGFAYRGLASSQPYQKDSDFYLPGGLEQLWIPGLQKRDFRFNFFGWVNDRMDL